VGVVKLLGRENWRDILNIMTLLQTMTLLSYLLTNYNFNSKQQSHCRCTRTWEASLKQNT